MSLSNSDHFDALAYPLRFDADRGRYAKSTDYADYVKGLVVQVLMTAQGQRINRPNLGTPLSQLLFAPINDELTSLIEAQVTRALSKWLDKIIAVESVTARQLELTRLEVEVSYTVFASGDRVKTLLEITP